MKNKLPHIITSLLFGFVVVIIVVNVFRRANSGVDLSFNGFLSMLSNSNSYSINVNISDFSINADWGLLNGLKNFFNVFANIFGVVVWLGSNLLNLVLFLGQFVAFVLAV